MKILWVKSDYLHPTNRGGQIRTLEMLRCLRQRHEIHYVCFDDGTNSEGPKRCREYCAEDYPVRHSVPPRRSLRFAGQLANGLFSSVPVSVARYRSAAMKLQVETLLKQHRFDSVVCDFLFPAPNIPDLSQAVLFQHNVEASIWQRHAAQARNAATRAYLSLQAKRMRVYEEAVCRAAGYVIAVSDLDRDTMRHNYGVGRISSIPTGVDVSYFEPVAPQPSLADLVFVGSMDWLPNIDGAKWFLDQIYGRILARMPQCRVAFVGRKPEPWLEQIAKQQPNVIVTGTVPDVRPWLWGAAVSIVPLRIGGGTRLKIFEAMAARVPVISTAIGAEGLPVEGDRHLVIEDDPARFADSCLDLLNDQGRRQQLAASAFSLVAGQFSWEAVSRQFEKILAEHSPQAERKIPLDASAGLR
jgi:polysaccharide biosynthesis protein PslH